MTLGFRIRRHFNVFSFFVSYSEGWVSNHWQVSNMTFYLSVVYLSTFSPLVLLPRLRLQRVEYTNARFANTSSGVNKCWLSEPIYTPGISSHSRNCLRRLQFVWAVGSGVTAVGRCNHLPRFENVVHETMRRIVFRYIIFFPPLAFRRRNSTAVSLKKCPKLVHVSLWRSKCRHLQALSVLFTGKEPAIGLEVG